MHIQVLGLTATITSLCIHTYIHIHIHIHIHTCIYRCWDSQGPSHPYAYIHTYIHIHTHTYMHIQVLGLTATIGGADLPDISVDMVKDLCKSLNGIAHTHSSCMHTYIHT